MGFEKVEGTVGAGADTKSESPLSMKSSMAAGCAGTALGAAVVLPFLMLSFSLPPTAVSLVGADSFDDAFALGLILTSSSSSSLLLLVGATASVVFL